MNEYFFNAREREDEARLKVFEAIVDVLSDEFHERDESFVYGAKPRFYLISNEEIKEFDTAIEELADKIIKRI